MKDERRWVLEGLSSSRPVGLQLQLLQCCCFVFWGFFGLRREMTTHLWTYICAPFHHQNALTLMAPLPYSKTPPVVPADSAASALGSWASPLGSLSPWGSLLLWSVPRRLSPHWSLSLATPLPPGFCLEVIFSRRQSSLSRCGHHLPCPPWPPRITLWLQEWHCISSLLDSTFCEGRNCVLFEAVSLASNTVQRPSRCWVAISIRKNSWTEAWRWGGGWIERR